MNESEALWAAEKKKMGYTFLQIAEGVSPDSSDYREASPCQEHLLEPGTASLSAKLQKSEGLCLEALLDGYTLEEIAAAMGLSTYSVKTLLEGKCKLMPPLTTQWIERSDDENE